MIKIAVYGTLRAGFGNHRLMEDSTLVGSGLTKEKYTMYASGIPYVDKDEPTSRIRVEVYDVKDEDLPSIDSLEGHPSWYRREEIPVELDNGEEVDAWLYFMPGVGKNSGNLTKIESGDYTEYRKEYRY